ncbi:MAG: hypothetical protein K0Q72_2421, partial [Armatimonadetes bacterium]|nr:hypothetical protein [Armatimonadota bacterium]
MAALNRRELIGGALTLLALPSRAAEAPTRQDAAVGLRRAVEFFRSRVGVKGGYLWLYSEDLARR